MGEKSAIEWTDATWNPVTGCSKVSPGCAHCYAETLSLRMGWSAQPWTPEHADANVILHPDRLDLPLRWRSPKRIFVNSMSDLFHELVPDSFICQVFTVMRRCQQHTFQVLTKRPERMRAFMQRLSWHSPETGATGLAGYGWQAYLGPSTGYLPPNIQLGTSVENQHWADVRIPELLRTPAAVRFLSCEPLLGPLDLTPWLDWRHYRKCARCYGVGPDGQACAHCGQHVLVTPALDWVIVGGESGAGYRPMQPEWVQALRDQCLTHPQMHIHPAFLFKQWGGRTPKAGGRLLDGRTWDEYPAVPA